MEYVDECVFGKLNTIPGGFAEKMIQLYRFINLKKQNKIFLFTPICIFLHHYTISIIYHVQKPI